MRDKPKTKKKTVRPYTKGELNKFIDSVCHPLFKAHKGIVLVDGLLHAMVEQNPPTTVQKFIKYNLPKIVNQLGKERKEETAKR